MLRRCATPVAPRHLTEDVRVRSRPRSTRTNPLTTLLWAEPCEKDLHTCAAQAKTSTKTKFRPATSQLYL